jgi:hypothetical protein
MFIRKYDDVVDDYDVVMTSGEFNKEKNQSYSAGRESGVLIGIAATIVITSIVWLLTGFLH